MYSGKPKCPHKVHVLSWALALDKDGYTQCHFKNCKFMAMTIDEMVQHFNYSECLKNVYNFTCGICNLSTDLNEKLLYHRIYCHAYDATEEERLLVKSFLMVKKEGTLNLRRAWVEYQKAKGYIKCLNRACLYVTPDLGEMEEHYLKKCKEEFWRSLEFECHECHGRFQSSEFLNIHNSIHSSMKEQVYKFKSTHMAKDLVKEWAKDISTNKQTSCPVPGCRFVSNNIIHLQRHYDLCKGKYSQEYKECRICKAWITNEIKLLEHVRCIHKITDYQLSPRKSLTLSNKKTTNDKTKKTETRTVPPLKLPNISPEPATKQSNGFMQVDDDKQSDDMQKVFTSLGKKYAPKNKIQRRRGASLDNIHPLSQETNAPERKKSIDCSKSDISKVQYDAESLDMNNLIIDESLIGNPYVFSENSPSTSKTDSKILNCSKTKKKSVPKVPLVCSKPTPTSLEELGSLLQDKNVPPVEFQVDKSDFKITIGMPESSKLDSQKRDAFPKNAAALNEILRKDAFKLLEIVANKTNVRSDITRVFNPYEKSLCPLNISVKMSESSVGKKLNLPMIDKIKTEDSLFLINEESLSDRESEYSQGDLTEELPLTAASPCSSLQNLAHHVSSEPFSVFVEERRKPEILGYIDKNAEIVLEDKDGEIKIDENTEIILKDSADEIEVDNTDISLEDNADEIDINNTDILLEDSADEIEVDNTDYELEDSTDEIEVDNSDIALEDSADEIEVDNSEILLKESRNEVSVDDNTEIKIESPQKDPLKTSIVESPGINAESLTKRLDGAFLGFTRKELLNSECNFNNFKKYNKYSKSMENISSLVCKRSLSGGMRMRSKSLCSPEEINQSLIGIVSPRHDNYPVRIRASPTGIVPSEVNVLDVTPPKLEICDDTNSSDESNYFEEEEHYINKNRETCLAKNVNTVQLVNDRCVFIEDVGNNALTVSSDVGSSTPLTDPLDLQASEDIPQDIDHNRSQTLLNGESYQPEGDDGYCNQSSSSRVTYLENDNQRNQSYTGKDSSGIQVSNNFQESEGEYILGIDRCTDQELDSNIQCEQDTFDLENTPAVNSDEFIEHPGISSEVKLFRDSSSDEETKAQVYFNQESTEEVLLKYQENLKQQPKSRGRDLIIDLCQDNVECESDSNISEETQSGALSRNSEVLYENLYGYDSSTNSAFFHVEEEKARQETRDEHGLLQARSNYRTQSPCQSPSTSQAKYCKPAKQERKKSLEDRTVTSPEVISHHRNRPPRGFYKKMSSSFNKNLDEIKAQTFEELSSLEKGPFDTEDNSLELVSAPRKTKTRSLSVTPIEYCAYNSKPSKKRERSSSSTEVYQIIKKKSLNHDFNISNQHHNLLADERSESLIKSPNRKNLSLQSPIKQIPESPKGTTNISEDIKNFNSSNMSVGQPVVTPRKRGRPKKSIDTDNDSEINSMLKKVHSTPQSPVISTEVSKSRENILDLHNDQNNLLAKRSPQNEESLMTVKRRGRPCNSVRTQDHSSNGLLNIIKSEIQTVSTPTTPLESMPIGSGQRKRGRPKKSTCNPSENSSFDGVTNGPFAGTSENQVTELLRTPEEPSTSINVEVKSETKKRGRPRKSAPSTMAGPANDVICIRTKNLSDYLPARSSSRRKSLHSDQTLTSGGSPSYSLDKSSRSLIFENENVSPIKVESKDEEGLQGCKMVVTDTQINPLLPRKRGRPRKKPLESNESIRLNSSADSPGNVSASVFHNSTLQNSSDTGTNDEGTEMAEPAVLKRKRRFSKKIKFDNEISFASATVEENQEVTTPSTDPLALQDVNNDNDQYVPVHRRRHASKKFRSDSFCSDSLVDLNSDEELQTYDTTNGNNSSTVESENEAPKPPSSKKGKKPIITGRVDVATILDDPHKQVKCAVCAESMTAIDYQIKHLPIHNFMAWLEGEEPLPVNDIDAMVNILARAKRYKPNLVFTCESCKETRKSPRGFLIHAQNCGQSPDQTEDLENGSDSLVDLNSDEELQTHDTTNENNIESENEAPKPPCRKKGKKPIITGRVDVATILDDPHKQVKCAVCEESMTAIDYQIKHLPIHNFMSWLEGEEPLPVNDIDAMVNILARAKRYKPNLVFTCESCKETRKSPRGFLIHAQNCGQSPDQTEDLENTVQVNEEEEEEEPISSHDNQYVPVRRRRHASKKFRSDSFCSDSLVDLNSDEELQTHDTTNGNNSSTVESENEAPKPPSRKKGKKPIITGRVDVATILDDPHKQVKCAVCEESMTAIDYQIKHLPIHNFMAWLEGEEPLPVNNIDAMVNILARAKRYKPNLVFTCESCKETRKSPRGFLIHAQNCGQSPDQTEDLENTVQVNEEEEEEEPMSSTIAPGEVVGSRTSAEKSSVKIRKVPDWRNELMKAHCSNESDPDVSLPPGESSIAQRPRTSLTPRQIRMRMLSGRIDAQTKLKFPKKEVKCGVCGESMTASNYQKVHLLKHNFMAWVEGEDPLPLDDFDSMINVMIRGKKKYPKFLFTCEVCGEGKRSAIGFLSHRQFCGITEDEKEKLLVTCPYCGRLMMPVSLNVHMYQYHRVAAEQKEEEVVEPQDTMRKAAAKCLDKIAGFIDAGDTSVGNRLKKRREKDPDFQEIKEKDIGPLYKLSTKRPSRNLVELWKKLEERGEPIQCKFPQCEFVCASREEISNHFKSCELDPPSYSCRKCRYQSKREEEMQDHVQNCSQSEHSEGSSDDDDVNERTIIPFLKTEESDLIHRKKLHFFKPAMKWIIEERKKHYSQTSLFPEYQVTEEIVKEVTEARVRPYMPEEKVSMSLLYRSKDFNQINFLDGNILEGGKEGVGFAGGPIWGMAWCPSDGAQYLAIATHRSMETELQVGSTYNGPGLIQMWTIGNVNNTASGVLERMEFVYGICHEDGGCWEMAWCPSGGVSDSRMGLLALAATSGTIPIFAVPHPSSLRLDRTKYFKLNPVVKLVLSSNEKWQCSAISWSKIKPHRTVVAGFVNGIVGVWDLGTTSSLLRSPPGCIRSYRVFQAHRSFITGLCLSPENENIIVSTAFDKTIKFWDLDDTSAPLSVSKRGLPTSVDWMGHWMMAATTYDVAYTLSQTTINLSALRGFLFETTQVISSINSTAWCVSSNEWLNCIACAYDNGQITISFALKHMMQNQKDKKKFTKVVLKSALHELPTPGTSSQSEESDLSTTSYKLSSKKYGLEIKTDMRVHSFGEKDLLKENVLESPLDVYPLASINKVAWNPNKQGFCYMAMGYQSGFLVISKISFPYKEQVHIDSIAAEG